MNAYEFSLPKIDYLSSLYKSNPNINEEFHFIGKFSYFYTIHLIDKQREATHPHSGFQLVTAFQDGTAEINLIIDDLSLVAKLLHSDLETISNIVNEKKELTSTHTRNSNSNLYSFELNKQKMNLNINFSSSHDLWKVHARLLEKNPLIKNEKKEMMVKMITIDHLKMYTNSYIKPTLKIINMEKISLDTEIKNSLYQ